MKQFYVFVQNYFTLQGNMKKVLSMKIILCLGLLFCGVQTAFSQPESYVDFRIVNLKYDPAYTSWDYLYSGKAVVFDLQVKPGQNYGFSNFSSAQILIEFMLTGNLDKSYTGFIFDIPNPNPYGFNRPKSSYDNPYVTRDIIYITIDRGINLTPLPNDYVTICTVFAPVYDAPASGDHVKILPRIWSPIFGYSNTSFWNGAEYPFEEAPISFCIEKFYYGIDPYAKADFSAITTLHCVGDPYYLLPTSVLDTNSTDPVNQDPLYYNTWMIPGKWQVGGVDVTSVNTSTAGKTTYTFVPLPTDGYCNFSNANLEITVTNPNNIQIDPINPECDGVEIDLRDAVTLLDMGDIMGNYDFYEKVGAIYNLISPKVTPPVGTHNDRYFIKNTSVTCPGAQYILIAITVKEKPGPPTVTPECDDPLNNWITGLTIEPFESVLPPYTGYTVSLGGIYTTQWTYTKTDLWTPNGSPSYNITVQKDGCISDPTYVTCVVCPSEPEIESIYAAKHPSSCGWTDGEIQFYVSGGSGDFSYNVYNSHGNIVRSGIYTTGLITGLGAGTYYVEVTDTLFDCSTIKSQYITLREEGSDLIVQVTAEDASTCTSTDGTLYISASGSTGNYNYTVIGTTKPIVNGKIEGLAAGEYEVIVTSGVAAVCTASSGKVRINSKTHLDAFDMNIITQSPSVCDDNDGAATIAIFGTMPYSYQIDYRPVKHATKADDIIQINDLGAGEHTLRLFSSCAEKVFKFTIKSLNNNDLSFKVKAENVKYFCDDVVDGKITMNILTGVAPYQYSIDNSAWAPYTNGTPLSVKEGTYKIRVKDVVNCLYEVNDVTIGLEKAQSVTVGSIYVLSHPTGCGLTNGSITFDVSGGSGSYSYVVYKGGAPYTGPFDYPAGVPLTNLGAGTYYVKVTDKNHTCDVVTSASVTLVEQNSDLVISVTAKDASTCTSTDGALYISVSGGSGTYNYSVIGTTKPVVDGKIEGLPAGEYEVIVTSGTPVCTASSGKVRINSKDDWDAFSMTALYIKPTPCGEKQGVAILQITGNLPYGYQLNYEGSPIPAAKATEVITLENLEAGEHTLLLISPCAERAFTFTVPNSGNNALVFTIEKKNAVEYCDGDVDPGAIKFNIGAGVAPFQYSLDGTNWLPLVNGYTLSVKEGTYKIRVRDAAECLYVINDVTIEKEQAPPVTIGTLFAATNPVCKDLTGGSIQFYVSGGSGSYEYELYKGGVFVKGGIYNGSPVTGLSVGNYKIHVWDPLHICDMAVSQDFVLNNAGTALEVTVTPTNASDCTTPNGSLAVSVNGGIPEFYALYDGLGNELSNNPPPYTLLPAGIYIVQVTDEDGCIAVSKEVRIVSEPDASGLSLTILDNVAITACGINNGVVIFEIEGNTPYYYQLNSGEIVLAANPETVILSGLSAGEHKLRVFNDCGEITGTFYIGTNSGTTVTAVPGNSKTDCAGNTSDGYIVLTVTGTSSVYSYTYDGGLTWKDFTGTTDTIKNLKQGIYLVEVMDEEGCVYQVSQIEILREVQCDLELELTVFLQGVTREGPLMTTYLQSPPRFPGLIDDGLLPIQNPYTNQPEFYHQINDNLGPAGKIVDWVLVEILANFEAFSLDGIDYTNYTLIESQALLLKPDGRIVDTTGNNPKFTSYSGGNVRIAIKHRNHLSIVSSALLPFDSNLQYDFSDSETKALKLSWARYEPTVFRNGAWCMYAGDLWNGNPTDATRNVINATDIERFNFRLRLPAVWVLGSYMLEDVNMDGMLDSGDDIFIYPNARQVTQSPLLYFIKRP